MVAGFFRELKHQVMILNQVPQNPRIRDLLRGHSGTGRSHGRSLDGGRVRSPDPRTVADAAVLPDREGQLATIIIGGFVFALSFLFTLGEVINWVEEKTHVESAGAQPYDGSIWRPALHVLGTSVVGVGGLMLMRAWCT